MTERARTNALEDYIVKVRAENASMHEVRISFLLARLKDIGPEVEIAVLNSLCGGLINRFFKSPLVEGQIWRDFLSQGWANMALTDITNWLGLAGDFDDYRRVRMLKLMRLRDWVYYKGPGLVLIPGLSKIFGVREQKMAEANDPHIKARARELGAEYLMTDMKLTDGAACLLFLPTTLGLVEAIGVAADMAFNIGMVIDELAVEKEALVSGERQLSGKVTQLHGSIMAADIHNRRYNEAGVLLVSGSSLARQVENLVSAAKDARSIRPQVAQVARGAHDLSRRSRGLEKLKGEFYDLAVDIAQTRLPSVIKHITSNI